MPNKIKYFHGKLTNKTYIGGLCRSSVVDGMVLHVLGKPLALVKPLLKLGVCDVARHDQGPCQAQPCPDRVRRELVKHLRHRLVQINLEIVYSKKQVCVIKNLNLKKTK